MNKILKKSITLFFTMCLALSTSSSFSQQLTKADNDLLFSDIGQKQIVALGDATHTDYTATKFRVDLIKELVEKHNFSIIGIESNLYEVYKAFEDFKTNGNIVEMSSSLYFVVRSNELDKLFFYLKEQNEKGNNVKVFGFDSEFSGENHHLTFIKGIQSNSNNTEMKCKDIVSLKKLYEIFEKIQPLTPNNLKPLLSTKKEYRTLDNFLTCYLNNHSMSDENKILNQSLSNLKVKIDNNARSYNIIRDSLMFDNIIYLKNKYPDEKMILFGSSTHFQRKVKASNSKFAQNSGWINLGERLSEKFPDDYFFIAYTAISGNTRDFYGKKKKLKKLIPNSIESIVSEKYSADTEIMYLSVNRDKSVLDEAVSSRFMGNTFLEMDISMNADGLFFIKNNNMD